MAGPLDKAEIRPAAIQAELNAERQAVLGLRRELEERDDELAAAREANRRLMNQVNRPGA